MLTIKINKEVCDEILKSIGKKDLSKLHKEVIVDKNGKRKTVWKKNEQIKNNDNGSSKEDDNANNTSSINIGDYVEFKNGDIVTTGEVVAKGKDGLIVDGTGKQKGIRYKVKNESVMNSYISPNSFNAEQWKEKYTDKKATNNQEGIDYVLSLYGKDGKEIAKKAKETEKRVKEQTETISKYRLSGDGVTSVYTPERERLHNKILQSFFDPNKLKSAKPNAGEDPTFIMLGGRGGSGKSKFKGLVYDDDKFIVIDADAIKEQLPEYEGWNAGEVHEESSDLAKKIIDMSKKLGLNIVIDGTMGDVKKAVKQMQDFKSVGYKTEAHYMFLPVQESTKRAIGRFKTEKNDYSGRFVPLNMLVGMVDNEKAFDEVKKIADNWTFNTNYGVGRNDPPKVISKKI
ncbi:MAG: zeta toxin family protein [Treponemataceae bacterium]